jgi:transcriptional regulator with XRE-family HTH domain
LAKKGPLPTDVVVGRNIRLRRLEKRLSQTDLGHRLGVTFQQIQKYENGTNRVGAGRLLQIAEVLDVPVQSFFEGARPGDIPETGSPSKLISGPQALRLARAFARIEDSTVRRAVVGLVEGIADRKKRGRA